MKRSSISMILLVLLASSLSAQSPQESARVDSTFLTESGKKVRFQGELGASDLSGELRAEALSDDRLPRGYGWETLRDWKEGDLRPAPLVEDGRVRSEFFSLEYPTAFRTLVALSFLEYTDFVYFTILERLGWSLDRVVPLETCWDPAAYRKHWDLPWWVPGVVRDGKILVQPMSMLMSRGLAMETLTHLYVELLLREKTQARLPDWFIYGAGAFFGDEGWVLEGQVEVLQRNYEIRCEQGTMIRDLNLHRDPAVIAAGADDEDARCRSRIAYWRAFRLMQNILLQEGQKTFAAMVDSMESDPALDFEAALQAHYGMSLTELVSKHEPWN
ncbi:MAG: hypothetical protein QGG80_04855 [Candidatus Krumholzibacteria bacterium]|nr:hypothetical protein [Candidatus Krumholzibacteria bacterium]